MNISCIYLSCLHCSDFIYLCLTSIILGLLVLVISFYECVYIFVYAVFVAVLQCVAVCCGAWCGVAVRCSAL